MTGKLRIASAVALSGLTITAVLILSGILFLRSNWIENRSREQVISAIETATGGSVTLRSFRFDWHTLTADLQNLTIHGTEPPGRDPLFHATSVRIGFRIVSLLRRDIDLASLDLDRPTVSVLVRPDGTTNIPGPKVAQQDAPSLVNGLLHLKLGRFDVHRGSFVLNAQRFPMDVRGNNLELGLNYVPRVQGYEIALAAPAVYSSQGRFTFAPANLRLSAELERNRLTFHSASVQWSGLDLRATGAFTHFAQPNLDLNLDCNVGVTRFASAFHIPKFPSGDLVVHGNFHYDQSASWQFQGYGTGRNVTYRSSELTLSDANLRSNLNADGQRLELRGLSMSVLGAVLTGDAALDNWKRLTVRGKVTGLDLSRASRNFLSAPLAWNGMAHGPLDIGTSIVVGPRNVTIQSRLVIEPGSHGTPISGMLNVDYKSALQVLTFADSHIELPNNRLWVSGTVGTELAIKLNSNQLSELRPALAALHIRDLQPPFAIGLNDATVNFDGRLKGNLRSPQVDGGLALTHFQIEGKTWDALDARFALSSGNLSLASLSFDQGPLHGSGAGKIALVNWSPRVDSALSIGASFKGADVAKLLAEYWAVRLPISQPVTSGSFTIGGNLNNPHGEGRFAVDSLDAYGQRLNHVQFAASISGDNVSVTSGRIQAESAVLSFSGAYKHLPNNWQNAQVEVQLSNTNGFPLASLSSMRKLVPGLDARVDGHWRLSFHVAPGQLDLKDADGKLTFKNISVDQINYGSLAIAALTKNDKLIATVAGDLQGQPLGGNMQVHLADGTPISGEIRSDRIRLSTLRQFVTSNPRGEYQLDGFLKGSATFQGELRELSHIKTAIRIDDLEIDQIANDMRSFENKNALILRNVAPIVIHAADGTAQIETFRLAARDSDFNVAGSFGYREDVPLDLRLTGSLDLKLLELFNPGVQSSGASSATVTIAGTLDNPRTNGTIQIKNGSFFLKNLTNGLSNLNGAIRFNRDRATIQEMTAETGGGKLQLTGFASFGARGPFVYNLQANASNVRFRYAGSISVTSNSELHLTGTGQSGLLSGNLTVSRVVVNPNADLGNLLASTASPASQGTEQDLVKGLQLDIHVESTPNLQVSTALSQDVQADVDMRLRGTSDHPVLLGNISANQGDVKVFGAKYSINRGQISFVNTVKFEPVLDLDLETQARGITVDITISGTPSKLSINYRSDPPLQPKDILALLTVGQTPTLSTNTSNAQVTNDVSALQAGADTVLGQAISPGASRLSKLFGITNIKIDPLVQGITNTPQARLTLEQQVSRDITVTYITNLAETSEQIFRFEWAINRQYSLVAIRDDNGEFGLDIQFKKRFK